LTFKDAKRRASSYTKQTCTYIFDPKATRKGCSVRLTAKVRLFERLVQGLEPKGELTGRSMNSKEVKIPHTFPVYRSIYTLGYAKMMGLLCWWSLRWFMARLSIPKCRTSGPYPCCLEGDARL